GGGATAENITTDVNVNPSLTVEIDPDGPLNLNLDPSVNTFGTKTINITVGTNNDTGYTLNMTSTTTDLVNIADNTKTIPTLTNKTGGYTDTDFSVNSWGYKQDSNNYNDFKLSQTILENNDRTNADTTTLTFATKIDYLKESGTYKNTITFSAVANPLVDYIQDFTTTICQEKASSADYVVVDKRDDNEYTVRYINNNCWMTSNLRYVGDTGSTSGYMIMKADTSNIGADTTTTYYQLNSSACNATNGMINPCLKEGVDNNGNPTTYYNYAIASAGTITGATNNDTQIYDICPSGWRLPSNNEMNILYSYGSSFNLIYGGFYWDTVFYSQYVNSRGIWWGSEPYSNNGRYGMRYNAGTFESDANQRYAGIYIRCIRN
ncbi:hypothetical protein IJI18_00195, partial [Candidatus Saccharibacteria bacterium]|nr:hypothetical protein [Candidatus Saccharibacteria bacterium]